MIRLNWRTYSKFFWGLRYYYFFIIKKYVVDCKIIWLNVWSFKYDYI